jgi:hypothetical protein
MKYEYYLASIDLGNDNVISSKVIRADENKKCQTFNELWPDYKNDLWLDVPSNMDKIKQNKDVTLVPISEEEANEQCVPTGYDHLNYEYYINPNNVLVRICKWNNVTRWGHSSHKWLDYDPNGEVAVYAQKMGYDLADYIKKYGTQITLKEAFALML